MWKVKMKEMLVTQGLRDVIHLVTKKEWTLEQAAEIDRKAKGTIILSLVDLVKNEV